MVGNQLWRKLLHINVRNICKIEEETDIEIFSKYRCVWKKGILALWSSMV
jgi:hypothetical protein